ncbi:sensor histidine kinase [Pseudonocardia spinosispora]|uniref:sensor histidine kinase n=1 Tax=Pseudonocardia spinosispora TaxID=103441 RepID=UPI001FE20FFF|nr:histidine kinase [Pseudonocardia spinosispora]
MQQTTAARWWGSLRTTRRDAAFDVALTLAVQCLLVAMLWPLMIQHGPIGLIVQLCSALVLLFRRTAPLTVLFLMVLNTVGLLILGHAAPDVLLSTVGDQEQAWIVLAVPFVIYSALVYGTDRRRAWVMIGILTVISARPDDPGIFDRLIGLVFVIVLAALLGIYVANLNERVARAERDQHRLAEQARVEERVRLAAEMHDVVTHRISLMVLQAGALGVTASDATTRAAAEDLRAAGCQALEELRDLVGVLRSSPGEVTEDFTVTRAGGQAAAPDFADLIAESESVGLSVTLDQVGRPSSASPVVGRTAYRIVQESLTNVRKHAPGATASVRLSFGAERVRVSIRNTAPGPDAGDLALTASGSGTGLLGLRQRVELVSGALRAEPTEDGGFEVDATLPAYVPTRDNSVPTRGVEPAPRRARLVGGAPTRVRGAG